MNIALLLSGGTGTRMGLDVPKQYVEVAGRTIISYCIERLSLHPGIHAIWIVADLPWHNPIMEWLEKYDSAKKFKGFSKPGKNRQLSILSGLEDIRQSAQGSDFILIHDAARPLISEKLISDCLEAVTGHDGVMPVLPMKDTVYCSKDGEHIHSLLNRSRIFAGQAPEVFRLQPYYEANLRLLPKKILEVNGSTEPAVLVGMDMVMIAGEENNFKITTREDLKKFCDIIRGTAYSEKEQTDESNGFAWYQ